MPSFKKHHSAWGRCARIWFRDRKGEFKNNFLGKTLRARQGR